MANCQTTGTILGEVNDESGAVVTGAKVRIEDLGTGLVRTVPTNELGSYLVPALPPGAYKVTVEAAGFKMFSHSGIRLDATQNVRVDARLQLGAVSDVVDVQSRVTQVDTQSSVLGAAIDRQRLVALPLNGRNVLELAQLMPGVGRASFPTVVVTSRSGPTVSVSGGRGRDNNITLDGTTITTGLFDTAQNLPSPDALQEFRILTNTYGAEYGRGGSAIFMAVTKSGSNIFHGAVGVPS